MNYDIFKIKNNTYLTPVLHGTLFFTVKLREMLLSLNPDIIAVELPSWAKNIILGLGLARIFFCFRNYFTNSKICI